MLSKINVPGLFWVALIVFVIQWLPQIFPPADYGWVQAVLLGLYALLKAVEVLVGVAPFQPPSEVPQPRATRSKVTRLFF